MARLTIDGATLTRLRVPLVKPSISSQARGGHDGQVLDNQALDNQG